MPLPSGLSRLSGAVIWALAMVCAPQRMVVDASAFRLSLFQGPPSNLTADLAWNPQPAVELFVRDDFGVWRLETGSSGLSAIAALVEADATSESYGTYQPPLATSSFSSGLAHFSGLAARVAGAYRLRVLVPGVGDVLSPRFTVAPGAPARYGLHLPPSTATGGLPFWQQPVVRVEDAWGNVVPSITAAMPLAFTASALSGPAGVNLTAALGGTLTVAVVDGVAAFTDLRISAAGGYVLRFTSSNASATGVTMTPAHVDSAPFTVGVGRTSRLVLTTQPSGGSGGAPFSAQPVLELRDEGGNVNTGDSDSFVTVRLGVDPSHRAALAPAFRWVPFPPGGVAASVTGGSSFVDLVGSDANVSVVVGLPGPGTGRPGLGGGDMVGLGWPLWAGNASETGGQPAALAALALDPHATGHPGFAAAGRRVRRVVLCPSSTSAGACGAGAASVRLQLDAPWDGPSMANATLWRVTDGLTAPVQYGVASFAALSLDHARRGYRLLFVSSLRNGSEARWGDVDASSFSAPHGRGFGGAGDGFGFGGDAHSVVPGAVSVLSEPLDVAVGHGFSLVVLRRAGRGWAGNQPFGVQPAVALADAGGNVLAAATGRSDGSVRVTARLWVPNATDASGPPAAIVSVPLLDPRRAVVPLEEGVAEFFGLGVSLTSAALVAAADAAGAAVTDVRVQLRYELIPPGASAPASPLLASSVLPAAQLMPLLLSAEWMLTGFAGALDANASSSSISSSTANGRAADPTAGLPRLADRFGHAVAASGGIAAASALYAETPRLQERVQVIRVTAPAPHPTADARGFVPEVQTISLDADWRPEVQAVTLASAPGAPLSGWVSLSWGGRVTRPLSLYSDPGFVQAVVMEDLLPQAGGEDGRGIQGDVTAQAAQRHGACGPLRCLTSVTWTFTFANLFGVVPLLAVDVGSAPNATAHTARVQTATVVGGTFTLSMPQPDSEATVNPASASNASAACAMHFPGSAPGAAASSTAGTLAACASLPLYTTRALPFDVDAATLGAAVESDLHTGPVLVSYEGPLAFNDNALYGWGVGLRVWSLTFTPAPGSYDVPTLQPNASGLSGSGFPVVEVTTRTQGAGPADGSFRLSVGGTLTPPIPLNASAGQVQAALLDAAPGLIVDVRPRLESPTPSETSLEIATAWEVRVSRNATMSWPGDGQEDAYGYDAVTDSEGRPVRLFELQAALAVSDASPGNATVSATQAYRWLPAGAGLTAGVLYGTGAAVRVVTLGAGSAATAASASDSESARTLNADSGLQSGAVFLFAHPSRVHGWAPLQRIDPPTTDPATGGPASVEYGLFGHALSLSTLPAGNRSAGLLAVSAPGSRDGGALEVQSLSCNLTGGDAGLVLAFLGAATAPLAAASARGSHLKAALEALPTVQQVTLSPPDARLCDPGTGGNGTAAVTLITFLWPQDGDLPDLGLTIVNASSAGSGGEVAFITGDVVRGTRKASGGGTSGAAVGAVYLYEPLLSPNATNASAAAAAPVGNASEPVWGLTSHLVPPSADVATHGTGYGWAVACTLAGALTQTVAVGAPFHAGHAGMVYIYQRPQPGAGASLSAQAAQWNLTQSLTADTHNSAGGAGFLFGWALAFASEGDTLVVGTPGAGNGSGAVWVFKRQPHPGAYWLFDQLLRPSADPPRFVTALAPRAFGYAVSISGTAAVIGAPDTAVTRPAPGSSPRDPLASLRPAVTAASAGCAYVYDRLGFDEEGGYLHLRAVVAPEMAGEGDRVGSAVAAADNLVVVSGVRDVPSVEPNGDAAPIGAGQNRAGQPFSPGSPRHEVQWLTLGVDASTGGPPSVAERANLTIQGHFTVRWLSSASGGPAVARSTRPLPWDASPTLVRRALEQELGTGRLRVTRQVREEGAVGFAHVYTWAVTFLQAQQPSRYWMPHDRGQRASSQGLAQPHTRMPLLQVTPSVRVTAAQVISNASRPPTDAPLTADALTASLSAAAATDPRSVLIGSVLSRRLARPARPPPAAAQSQRPPAARSYSAFMRVHRANEASPWPAASGGAYVLTRDFESLPPPNASVTATAVATGFGAGWVAQAVLQPHAFQAGDQFGASVALAQGATTSAMVGAPARDVDHASAFPGTSSGGGFAFDLSFADAGVRDRVDPDDWRSVRAVAEGSGALRGMHAGNARDLGVASTVATVPVRGCAPRCVAADATLAAAGDPGEGVWAYASTAAGDDFGVFDEAGVTPAGRVAAMVCAAPAVSVASTASGSLGSVDYTWDWDAPTGSDTHAWTTENGAIQARAASTDAGTWEHGALPLPRGLVFPSQCAASSAGTDDCLFTRAAGVFAASGGYDSLGIQDFASASPALLRLAPSSGSPSASFNVTLTADAVVESPAEAVHVRLSLPGMRPLWGGHLWTSLAITDDGDGGLDGKRYMQDVRTAPLLGPHTPDDESRLMEADWARLGASVAIDAVCALVGAPMTACADGQLNCGAVIVMARAPDGGWANITALDGGPGASGTAGALVGSAVAITGEAAGTRVLAITAPGAAPPVVSLYRWNVTARTVAHMVTLAPQTSAAAADTFPVGREHTPHPLSLQHACGTGGSVSLSTDETGGLLLALGCSGLDAVFIFRDSGPSSGSVAAAVGGPEASQWRQTLALRPSDFSSRTVDGVILVSSPSLFGSAVKLSGRTLAVGAPAWGPSADAPLPRAWYGQDDANDASHARGSGAVFVFQMVPGIALDEYRPSAARPVGWGDLALWPAADEAVSRGLRIAAYDDGAGDAVWVQQARLISPRAGLGASSTDAGSHAWELFGASLDMDKKALIVGAPGTPLGPLPGAVTWDFETGDLRGWTATGGAFARQPTYGDNPSHRPEYSDALGDLPTARSRHTGRYWVGTYEARPAEVRPDNATRDGMALSGVAGGSGSDGVPATSEPVDVTAPPADVPPGTAQGDRPQGTLSSPPFPIQGDAIQLLAGGGCDSERVFVELRVDGQSVATATGGCSEELLPVTWDVSAHGGRTGVIRVVDASSESPWGHISLDDIRFSWTHARVEGAGAAFVYTRLASPGGEVYGGWAPTASSADTAPDREAVASSRPRGGPLLSEPCPADRPLACTWQLDTALYPRAATHGGAFGSAVSMDDSSGIAVVAAAEWNDAEAEGHLSAHTRRRQQYADARAANLFGPQGARADVYPPADSADPLPPSREADAARAWPTDPTDVADSVAGNGYADDSDAYDLSLHLPQAHIDALPGHASPRASLVGELGGAAALSSASRGGAGNLGFGFGGVQQLLLVQARRLQKQQQRRQAARSSGRRGGHVALHVYRSDPEVRGGSACGNCGPLVRPRLWPMFPTSVVRQPVGHSAYSPQRRTTAATASAASDAWWLLQPAVALSSFGALVGAPADGRVAPAGGSTWWSDLSHVHLSMDPRDFTRGGGGAFGTPSQTARLEDFATRDTRIAALGTVQRGYRVAENVTTRSVVVPVFRHGLWNDRFAFDITSAPQSLLASETLHVVYATADGSARGVSRAHADHCETLPLGARGAALCGDYVQAAGVLTFPPGVSQRAIVISLVDDDCHEPASEGFTVALYAPGGGALDGYGYSVTVTIDDDDSEAGFNSCVVPVAPSLHGPPLFGSDWCALHPELCGGAL